MGWMRLIGGLMVIYAIAMLALLAAPARDWALDYSIARVVSAGDRRVANAVDGPVDMPIAIAGSAVVGFAGLWFAIFVPWIINRNTRKMIALGEQFRREDAERSRRRR